MDRIGEPPAGGDENLGPTIIIINVIVFTASMLIIIIRIFTRLCLTKNFGWDDAFMVLTGVQGVISCVPRQTDMFQVLNAVGMGFVGTEVASGLGRKRYYLEPASYKKFLKYDYLDWIQVFLTLMISKISICLFLLRLSSFRKIRLGLHAMNIFLITSHIPLTFLIIFQCNPIGKFWRNPHDGPGKCFSKDTVAHIIIVQGGQFFPTVILFVASNERLDGRANRRDSEPSGLDVGERPAKCFSSFAHHRWEPVIHGSLVELIHWTSVLDRVGFYPSWISRYPPLECSAEQTN